MARSRMFYVVCLLVFGALINISMWLGNSSTIKYISLPGIKEYIYLWQNSSENPWFNPFASDSKPYLELLKDALAEVDIAEYGPERLSIEEQSKVIQALIPFLEDEPVFPLTVTKRPKPLRKVDCSNYNVFSGPRKKPARIFDLITISFEFSTLELRLYELDGIVDTFFVLESATTHRFGLKPLIFARNYERLAEFRDKIVHIVLDDVDILDTPSLRSFTEFNDEWSLERWQRKMAYDAFRKHVRNITEDDVIIHGDIDELPSGDFINHLKYCQPKSYPLAPQIMFFRFNFDWIHPTEYSINFPEIFTINQVKGKDNTLRGQVGNVIVAPWSGAHLTDYGLPAMILAKLTGLAEGGKRNELVPYLKNPEKLMERLSRGIRPCCPNSPPCKRHEDTGLPSKFIPWVALANKQHFPELFPSEFPEFLEMRKPRLRNHIEHVDKEAENNDEEENEGGDHDEHDHM